MFGASDAWRAKQTIVVWLTHHALVMYNMHMGSGGSKTTEWVTPKAIADVLGVHRSTVVRWVTMGRVAAIRTPGGRVLINKAELERITAEPVEPQLAA